MEQLAKGRIARDATLANAHDVRCGEVDRRSVGSVELLKKARVVVQRDLPRMGDPERVQAIRDTKLLQARSRLEHAQLREVIPGYECVVLHGSKRELVRQQRMHPIDGDELLG